MHTASVAHTKACAAHYTHAHIASAAHPTQCTGNTCTLLLQHTKHCTHCFYSTYTTPYSTAHTHIHWCQPPLMYISISKSPAHTPTGDCLTPYQHSHPEFLPKLLLLTHTPPAPHSPLSLNNVGLFRCPKAHEGKYKHQHERGRTPLPACTPGLLNTGCDGCCPSPKQLPPFENASVELSLPSLSVGH